MHPGAKSIGRRPNPAPNPAANPAAEPAGQATPAAFEDIPVLDDPELRLITDILRAGSGTQDPTRMLAFFGPLLSRGLAPATFMSVSRRGLGPDEFKVTRYRERFDLETIDAEPANPWRDWDSIPLRTGGLVAQLISRNEPRVFTGLDAADDPAVGGMLAHCRAGVALPIFDSGEALNWSLFFFEDESRVADRAAVAALLRTSVLNSNLLGAATRNLIDRRRLAEVSRRQIRQLEQIAGIQQSLLPASSPAIPGARIATSYLTSDESGGDYYDFFAFTSGARPARWGVIIADVAGHGASAATVMAMLRAVLHTYHTLHPRRSALAPMLGFASRHLTEAGVEGSFVTAFFAAFDPATGELEYTRAGHNPPRLRRADGAIEHLTGAGGLPLGVVADPGYETARVRLDPGDTLVLYTDGITEAMTDQTHNLSGKHGPRRDREMFGEHRLDAALAECSGAPDCVIETVHRRLFEFTHKRTRADDQTLVVLQTESRPSGDLSESRPSGRE